MLEGLGEITDRHSEEGKVVEEDRGVQKGVRSDERALLMLTLFSGDWMEISALSENLQIPKEKLDRALSTLQRWSFLDCRIKLDKNALPKKSALTQLGESVSVDALAATQNGSND